MKNSGLLQTVFGHTISEKIIVGVAIAWSSFQIYTGYFQLEAMDQRTIHLMFGFLFTYMVYRFNGKQNLKKLSVGNTLLGLIYFSIGIYFLITSDTRLSTIGMDIKLADMVCGVIFILLTLEGCRRVMGWSLPIMALLVFLFAICGEYLPGVFAHKNYPIGRLVSTMTLKTEGLFGTLTGMSATFIYILVLFGVLYNNSGAGQFFMKFSMSLAGHFRGGIAKVAVIASALFGMISGSGVANTAATGNMTIPHMIKEGYPPYFSGAVVAAAGSGGLIMPPIMGSAVFIIMSILGVPYIEIIKRSFIIAILFYFSVFLMVHFRSIKLDIKGSPKDQLPDTRLVLKEGWNYVLPPVVFLILLILGYTIIRASFWACIAVPLAAGLRKSTRMSLETFLLSLKEGAVSGIQIITVLAVAGIVVGLVDFTGLGLMISSILIELAHGNLFILLVLAMIASILLGMGVPPVASYVVLSILVVPALEQLGVWVFACHMFVFYFSVIAEISPPVAPNAYVACGIAKSPLLKTAGEALKIAFPIIILPYAFVYNNALLLEGSLLQIVLIVFLSICSVIAISCAWEQYCFGKLPVIFTIILAIAGVLLVYPNMFAAIVGLTLLCGIAFIQKVKGNKNTKIVSSVHNS
jgi:TRAP transporter 4TM/12TM fusion protein